MLKKITAGSQQEVDVFINSFMNSANGWAVAQSDCGKVNFPAQFVLVTDHRIKLATVEFLY